MYNRNLVLLFLALVIISVSFPYSLYNGALYCNTTCDDCEDALNNDTYNTIYLNSSLSSPGVTCINNPTGFSGKTFDCQGYMLSGDNTSSTWGISMVSKENISIQNCNTTLFWAAFRVIRSNWINFTNNTDLFTGYDAYELLSSNYMVISNNSIYHSTNDGIELNNCSHNTVEGNFAFYSNILFKASDFYVESGSNNNSIFNNTVYNATWAYDLFQSSGNTFIDNIALDSRDYDIYFMPSNEEDCNNIMINFTGSGGLPINYSNETVNWNNFESSRLILCNADDSIIANATIHTPAAHQVGGIDVWYLDNAQIMDSEIYSAYEGIYAVHGVNLSLIGNTIYDNYWCGIDTSACNDTIVRDNTVYGNTWSGICLYGNNETAQSNTVYDNEYSGIELYYFYSPDPYYIMISQSHSALSNTVYGNKLGGINVVWAHNATVANNTVHSQGFGFTDPLGNAPYEYNHYFGIATYLSNDTTIANNTVYSNAYFGIVINESDNATSTNDMSYNNGVADVATGTTCTSEVYFTNLRLDSSNYPNITITDQLEANTIYTIKTVSSPNTNYPGSEIAVQNRMINITNLTGSPTIDSLIFAWGSPEQNDYNESTFDLWRYVTSWVDMNATMDTTANTANYSSITTQGVYGLLGDYYYGGGGGGGDPDPECTEDSDCSTCEVCSDGTCELPSSACLSDGDCMGAGETCSSCSCILPECVDEGDCTGAGETCENYACVAPECVDDTDCTGDGVTCENYACVAPECVDDTDCSGEGETCENYVCTPPECVLNTDCALCEECTNYACIFPIGACTFDSQCTYLGTGYTCESCACMPPAQECTTNADCSGLGAGYECINNECIPPECTANEDCEECYECSNYACELPAGSCSINSDCLSQGEGYTCDSCSCVPPECTDNSECAGDGVTCENYVCVPPNCVEDEDCPGGYTCDNYACNAPECFYNDDCAEGQICKNYACMDKKEERPDSGATKPIEEIEDPQDVEVEGEDEGTDANQGRGDVPFVSEAIDSIAGIIFNTASPIHGAEGSPQTQVEETTLSEVGWFFVLLLGAIMFYFLLTKVLPKLPGGRG